MTLNIVYFHGYGSSPTTSKVEVLRGALNVPVFAFPANIDPEIAIAEVSHNIDMLLLDDMHAYDSFLFIGTSLGGWLASKLGQMYNIPAIIINPSVNPKEGLLKYGVDQQICNKYDVMQFSKNNAYFFAENDIVIPNEDTRKMLIEMGIEVYVDPEADHRFSGVPFNRVIEYVKNNSLVAQR